MCCSFVLFVYNTKMYKIKPPSKSDELRSFSSTRQLSFLFQLKIFVRNDFDHFCWVSAHGPTIKGIENVYGTIWQWRLLCDGGQRGCTGDVLRRIEHWIQQNCKIKFWFTSTTRTPLKARWTVLLRYLLIDLFRWLLRQFDRYLINRLVLTQNSAFHAHFSLRKGLALEKLIVLHTQPRRRQLLHDIVLPNCHLSEAQSRTVDLWQVVVSSL